MSENGTIHITMMKNWVSNIRFLRKRGLIVYLAALFFIRQLQILFVLLKKILYFLGYVCVILRVALLNVIVLSRFLGK